MFFTNKISIFFIYIAIIFKNGKSQNLTTKINACIFVLARNEDLSDLVNTIKRLELIFNNKYNYPYVILNNIPFTSLFKNEIVKHTQSVVEFGLIPMNEWRIPKWIDKNKIEFRSRERYYKLR